jgi:hypothetical protein
LLTGAGGNLHFVDQFRKSAYVHQYSVELQRELRGQMVTSVGYVGSRSENLSVGGTNSNTVNINQVDARNLSLGSALLAPVENPMFGNAVFGALGRQRTVPRGQLLRPYPQFLDVMAHQVSAGIARYNSLVLKFKKRMSRGWGTDINYTYSVNKDNLFGEVNYFSNNSSALARALNNYDLDAEFAHSILEAPHRLNISGVYELPFGRGQRWLSGGGVVDVFLGGWSVSGIGSYQSGFPNVIVQNNNNSGLFGSFQRPNLVSGVESGFIRQHQRPAQRVVQRGGVGRGAAVHLRRRAADRHPRPHAFQEELGPRLPEDAAAQRKSESDVAGRVDLRLRRAEFPLGRRRGSAVPISARSPRWAAFRGCCR